MLEEHSVDAEMGSYAFPVSGTQIVSELGLAGESHKSCAESFGTAGGREEW